MSDQWQHKDVWKYMGRNFCVEVSRHASSPSVIEPNEGVNRWAVYAYLYPEHWHFAAFDSDEMTQDATRAMPLHWGCSYLRIHRKDNGDIGSYQVGADYHHAYDQEFTHMATRAEADTVFYDAEKLIKWLETEPPK